MDYLRFDNSVDEPSSMVVNGPGGPQFIFGSGIAISASNNCASRTGNGQVGAQQRQTATTGSVPARIQALMDTLRRQAAPRVRLGYYQAEIRAYFFDQDLLPDLEAYALTLAAPNPAACLALGFDVMSYYRAQGQTADAARLRAALGALPLALASAPARARLAYYDVVGRLGATRRAAGRGPTPADSLALRRLLLSRQAEALEAGQWWAYYYPTTPVPTPAPLLRPDPAPTLALYPNPAHDALTVRVAGDPGPALEVRLVDLLTGRVCRQVPVSAETGQVSLRGLRPGTYACHVYVGGALHTTRRLVVE
ncbi:T9SS type A sorting domain-containing protein [Hymenobacter monticola]|uniref:T9SS type A sorting domain-containing protein n=1 Tax=Hymenobacter monticola TaxID=1705399 RepID=A0ABY4B5T6_9BACT|nr:T9SS type A sorting domain-containing protein [Hymenobacter monticola]UOE34395.1 T9SS type A sorting domain-containing protein [Hymenobacter monticola]